MSEMLNDNSNIDACKLRKTLCFYLEDRQCNMIEFNVRNYDNLAAVKESIGSLMD